MDFVFRAQGRSSTNGDSGKYEDNVFPRCLALRITKCFRHSFRIEPIRRSAYGFCQGSDALSGLRRVPSASDAAIQLADSLATPRSHRAVESDRLFLGELHSCIAPLRFTGYRPSVKPIAGKHMLTYSIGQACAYVNIWKMLPRDCGVSRFLGRA